MPPADNLEIRDPRAMRALAHPARLAILELLYEKGTANATEAARELGGSPQAASYHLRALAKWGLIGSAESSDGRETRWELTARSISFESGDDSPQFRSAARALGRRVLERDQRAIDAYLATEKDEPREWREAATFEQRHRLRHAGGASRVRGRGAQGLAQVRAAGRDRAPGREPPHPRRLSRDPARRPQAEEEEELMADPRIEQYARVMVEDCVDVQPGWQVVVAGGSWPPAARGGSATGRPARRLRASAGRLRREPRRGERVGS